VQNLEILGHIGGLQALLFEGSADHYEHLA
jgi:hypothetical protein